MEIIGLLLGDTRLSINKHFTLRRIGPKIWRRSFLSDCLPKHETC